MDIVCEIYLGLSSLHYVLIHRAFKVENLGSDELNYLKTVLSV